MKKTLLLIVSAALLLAGCAKEKFSPDAGSGEMVTANFTAKMQGVCQTKSVTDGEGSNANRCVMEIYYKGELYTRDVQSVSGMKATFTPRLVSNRTYDVLFWADCGDGLADKYYNTDAEGLGLRAVEMIATSYAANDDARDAFFANEEVPVGQQVSSETFTLTRPFSQVNIITTDAAIIRNANLYPDGAKMVYTAPTKFNLLTGELGEAKELTAIGVPYEAFDETSPALTLEMDYLFATEEKSALDIVFEASKTGETTVTSHSFTNIPVQRNYRTNIKGALLTTTGDWTATIVPGWNEPGEEVKFVEAGSVAAANEAFANGATSVKITSVGEETTLYLPVLTDEVTIDFANPLEVITVKYGPAPTKAAGDKPAAVNIATNDVAKFTVTGISNIVWLAGNQDALANALNNAAAGQTVALANDITMTGTWTPLELNADFNGNGHVIKGMNNTSCDPNYAGLFKVSYSNIKNVTIQNAEFAYGTETLDARGGILVGDMRRGSIENCHVVGAKFTGYQKVGGLVGFISANADNNTDISIKNCSVTNATFAACGANDGTDDDDYLYQAGGLVGYIALGNRNISISNCSVEDITYDNSKYKGVYDKPNTNDGYLSHTFVGAIFSQTNNAANTLAFTANTISGENTQLNANMYGSAYFGWARNPEYKPTETVTLGKITINGEEWTPNYPVKNVTKGKGYPTLAKAVADASAGDKITLVNGVYELPSSLSNITLEGIGDNVIASNTVSGTSNVTLKKFIINFPNDNYKGFQHASNLVLEGCTINGLITTYGSTTFKKCTFNVEEYAYNMNAYGAEIVCENCTFNGKGKAVYVYNEGNKDIMYHISFNKCVFNEEVGDRTDCKAAILVKRNYPNQQYIVNINECTANFDKYVPGDPDYTGVALWNTELGNNSAGADVKVYVDDVLMYDNAFLGIANKLALKNFADAVNAGKSFKGLTAFLVNDIDLAGETVTPIGAGDKKFDGIFDGKGKTISNIEINGSSNGTALFGHVWEATIKNLKITNAKVTNTALDYTGILAGNGYANISGCDINGTVEGQEQVGAVIGYLSCGSIMNCKVDATVKGTSRVGVLCAKANVDSQYKIEGNAIKGSATSDDIYAGGVVGQIMCGTGKVWTIKNNSIDATVSTGGSLIGNVRSGNWDAFVAGYQTNVTGNTWTAAGNCKITDGNPEHSVEISK